MVKVKGSITGINSIVKSNGILIPAINTHLLSKNCFDPDRKHGWNSPSGIGNCQRYNYFLRTNTIPDTVHIDPRLQRIFDNGTAVHVRLQRYLMKQGILLDDEAPLFNEEYQIMGTTDGLLLDGDSLAVLEIKSINSNSFKYLMDAKDEHKEQASVYMFCLNEMRKEILRGNRLTLEQSYLNKLSYLSDEKREDRFNRFKGTLDLLEKYPKPITKVIFLYESKDTQELKEFPLIDNKEEIKKALDKFKSINNAVLSGEIPPVETSFKCNSCVYKSRCKNV